jgi:hypothetical protein
MASKRAKEEENCISICSNLVSKPATFEAVSDILDTDVSSAFSLVRGAKVTEWVGVVFTVFKVLTEVFSLFSLERFWQCFEKLRWSLNPYKNLKSFHRELVYRIEYLSSQVGQRHCWLSCKGDLVEECR